MRKISPVSALDKSESWISKGYDIFSKAGELGLKVELLAKEVGISKSSFYHHFGDMDGFLERLMHRHLEMSKLISEKERQAKRIDPDLVNVLLEHKDDLLFNRQLRVNSTNPLFKNTLDKSTAIIGNDFVALWLSDTKSKITPHQAEGLFELAMENFFLQINAENVTREWLLGYFRNLNRILSSFEPSSVR